MLFFIAIGIVFNFIIWSSWHRMAWTALFMTLLTIVIVLYNDIPEYGLIGIPVMIAYGWVGSLLVKLFRQGRTRSQTQ